MIAPTSLWAVARQTFSQCLRMKIAVAFIVLLGVLLSVLPFVMKGDGTLAGSIRTFLSYSVSATGLLLSLVTVLAMARVVTSDVEEKQIYLLAVKPIPRWEYIVGRWLGVLLMDALLLVIAAGVIYLVARNMQNRPAADPTDRRAIETEIFAARSEVKPEPFDVTQAVVARVRELQTNGRLGQTIEEYQARGNVSRAAAEKQILAEIERSELAKRETAAPGKRIVWRFRGRDLDEDAARARGTVTVEKRDQQSFRISAPREFLGKLMYERPVIVDGIGGRVYDVSETDFDVRFAAEDMNRAQIERLRKDAAVELLAEPTFQFRYKAVTPNQRDFASMDRDLLFYSPNDVPEGAIRGAGPLRTAVTVSVPATGSLKKGVFRVEYFNPLRQPSPDIKGKTVPSPEVRIATRDVSILYRVAGFEMNFLQAMLLMFVQLVFLAALAVFLASFLSFPVAALSVLVLLAAGMLVGWMSDVDPWSEGWMGFLQTTVIKQLFLLALLSTFLVRSASFRIVSIIILFVAGFFLLQYDGSIRWSNTWLENLKVFMTHVVNMFMPRLSETSPSDRLVDGIYITWPIVGRTAGLAVGVRTVLYLVAGCLIFHRRELARVQV
jgi:hypothetical protein